MLKYIYKLVVYPKENAQLMQRNGNLIVKYGVIIRDLKIDGL